MKSVKIYIKAMAFIIAGFILGWIVFHNTGSGGKSEATAAEQKTEVWTCSMHPQIRVEKFGLCPLCAMDLIPLQQGSSNIDPDAIVMTEDAAKLADIQTSKVSRSQPVKEMRLYGKIQADERLVQTQPSHLSGRIEQLFVGFSGDYVSKGQVIAQIYAPTLITAQQELIEATKMGDKSIIDAIREKLRQWKLTEAQISEIEKNGKPKTLFDVTATVSGVVTNKIVNKGDYVNQGTPLYEIADLSHVWALFDAYETDLQWIRQGSNISFTVQSVPGKKYNGVVSFIDPMINPQTRIAGVRVEVDNSDSKLKPEMFITGSMTTKLATHGNSLVIPQSSILWTGTRSIVYVKLQDTDEPTFIMREIKLGEALSNSYIVLEGLEEGEEIVTNGTFSVDAAAQLSGKSSMMNGSLKKVDTNDIAALKIPDFTKTTDAKFKHNLTSLYLVFIEMKDAFVASDATQTSKVAKNLKKRIVEMNTSLLKDDTRKIWEGYADKMITSIQGIISEKDINRQREFLATFNVELYKSVKSFGMTNTGTYFQYCPMALDDRGAYWLSSTKEISNPYFGKSMLRCGEIKETIN